MQILIYGHSGWIGSRLCQLFTERGVVVLKAQARLEEHSEVAKEVNGLQKGDAVVCAAGLTGSHAPPYNVDWCEENKDEVVRVNVEGVLHLAQRCHEKRTHLTYVGTGCIYEYDAAHPIGGKGFTEVDWPNFDKSFYSKTKIWCEYGLRAYLESTLVLRVRMPLSADLHPRNFITKITRYQRVVNVPNSMTVLADLLPIAVDMTAKGATGIFNFCNPGTVSHNEILALYKQYVDPTFQWQNFSLEEQALILKAGRSNNELDCSKLRALYPELPDIKTALVALFQRFNPTKQD